MADRDCALCGAPARPPYRAPAAEMAPDLDLRPGEPARSTMRFWIQHCSGCGACAPDLTVLPLAARAVLDSPAYAVPDGPAAPFLRWATIAEATEQQPAAAEAMLQAAWIADDTGLPADARTWRRAAIALWGAPSAAEDALRQADILRRAGDFAAATVLLNGVHPQDDSVRAILAFQRDRIAVQDDARHSLSSALRPPARRPHASHGRAPAPRSLWSRLFGA